MLCEDALLFQYWDVKLHTGLLMHSGNHSPLLRLLATKTVRGPCHRGREIWFVHILVLFTDRDSLQWFCTIVFPLVSLSLCLRCSSEGGFIAHSSMAGHTMRRPTFSDRWHLPRDSPWHAHIVGFTVNKQTTRQLKCLSNEKEGNYLIPSLMKLYLQSYPYKLPLSWFSDPYTAKHIFTIKLL